MKNNFKKLFLFLLVAAAASCDVGDDEELNYGNGNFVAQFAASEVSGSFLQTGGLTYDYNVPVDLVGGNGLPINSDVIINFSVDTEASTAVEGVHFDFVNPVNTITITAGNTFALIPIKVHSGTLSPEAPAVIVLKIDSVSENVVKSFNNDHIKVVLNAFCDVDLSGTYNVSVVRESSGSVLNLSNEVITKTATNTFHTTSTATFTAGQAPDQGYNFRADCDRLVVPSQNLFGIYSNEVVGVPMTTGPYVGDQGHVIDANSFVIRYKANAGGATGFITVTATYTKN